MNTPFLSICIPMYNGGQHLGEALESITAQFENDPQLAEQVEIVCCDDGSSDDSVRVVKNFQSRFPAIQLLVNEKNIGFDRNVDKVLSAARGNFRWVLSQDEAIVPGSLHLLTSILSANPETAYVCISNERELMNHKDAQYFRSGSELLEVLGLKGGLLSQNIYNSKFLPADRHKYYGNLWFHYSLALEMVAQRPVVYLKNLFVESDHECRWAKGGKAFYTFANLKKIVTALPEQGYRKAVIKKLLWQFAHDLPRTVASAKIQGLPYSFTVVKTLVANFYHYPLHLLAALAVYVLPTGVLKVLRRAV